MIQVHKIHADVLLTEYELDERKVMLDHHRSRYGLSPDDITVTFDTMVYSAGLMYLAGLRGNGE